MFQDTATGGAHDPHRMGLVHQQIGAVLLLHRHEFFQRRMIAQHRIDAFDDDDLVAGFVGEARQALIEIDRIIVLEADDRGAAETAGVIDAGMTVSIDDQEVIGARQRRDGAQIGLIAGGEHHAMLLAIEIGKILLQRLVAAIGTVGDPRPGRTGAKIGNGLLRGLHAIGIEGEAEIIVGAAQDRRPTFDHGLGR